jgi:hypothetical protein
LGRFAFFAALLSPLLLYEAEAARGRRVGSLDWLGVYGRRARGAVLLCRIGENRKGYCTCLTTLRARGCSDWAAAAGLVRGWSG